MAVSLAGVLLLVVVSCQAIDCPYGKYWDPDYDQCRNCSPCPRDVIKGESQHFGAVGACAKYDSLCPKWCAVATPVSDANEGRDACRPMTPSPPVPYVNVTIDEPMYNATMNAYTASCSVFFSNMGTPSLEWSDPSGQVLTESSGKWNVNEGQVTQDAVTEGVISSNLQIKDFLEGDEGNYTCSARGEQSANQTVYLKYVAPPVTTSTPSPSTAPSSTTPGDSSVVPKPTSGEITIPAGGMSNQVVAAVSIAVVAVCLLCAFVAWFAKGRRNRPSRSRLDFESHPLTGTTIHVDVGDWLSLEASDDFKSATVFGIEACFDKLSCASVIIQHKKKNHKVQSGQNEFFIDPMAWNDSIEVYVKYRGKKKKERIKILKMNCLKIENVTETSAVVRCPSDENTFYCRFEEKDASVGSSSREGGELVRGGSKQIGNLRPQMTYCVHLGVRGRTGDSGPMNWVWKTTFDTKSVKFNEVSPGDSSAALRLTGHSIPGSVQLFFEINGSDPKQMTSTETQISSLIPGMDQLLQIKVREDIGGSTNYRLLEKIPFKTTGSLKGGGNYMGYATTDFPNSDPDDEPGPSTVRGKPRKRQSAPLTCDTGLLEAIHTLRDNSKYQQVYLHTHQSVLKAVLDSLLEFLKDFKDIVPNVRPKLSTNGSLRGLDHIESTMKVFAMQDYTGVFDLLKRFIEKPEVHSPEGISFAESLLEVHYRRRCHLCKHAVYLLKCYERKDIRQSSAC